MTKWKLILRSLYYYRNSHLGAALGTMLSTAILVGALVIGDSVRYSLKQIVFARLGSTQFALAADDRLFRSKMADELSAELQTTAAPVLQTKGIAILEGGRKRLNKVQVMGVDSRFGQIGNSGDFYNNLASDEAIINHSTAVRLNLNAGDEFLLRIKKLDFLPKDVPMALDDESAAAKHFKVKAIASASEFGRFNLKAEQSAVNSVYISLSMLNGLMDLTDRANVLLVSEKSGSPLSLTNVNAALKKVWTLSDAGLEILSLKDRDIVQLKSKRIFLDSSFAAAALKTDENAEKIFTYFVNEIRYGKNSTPYSFISAAGSSIVPQNLNDDEIIINEWLAHDLKVIAGDNIQMKYYILGPMRNLVEVSSNFKIKSIVPLQGKYLDKNLLPDFPGLTDEESCRSWKPGTPVDLDKIRSKDEDYWEKFGGTPKGFITLHAAQKMWQNRFGNLTALRFHNADKSSIENKIKQFLNPAQFGFLFRDVKTEGIRASRESVDFAELFLGLSFFIIVAAMLLTALLFVFSLDKRSEETGLFLALGFHKKQIKNIILFEGILLAIIGSLIGAAAGVFYNQVILFALQTVWSGAVGTSDLQIYISLPTILTGILIGIIISVLTMRLAVHKQAGAAIYSLQRGSVKFDYVKSHTGRMSYILAFVSLLGAVIIIALSIFTGGEKAAASFFIAGFLLLLGGISTANILLVNSGRNSDRSKLSLRGIGIRNSGRRRLRSLTLIGVLASGLFIVFTVGANRKIVADEIGKRESGTGGFAFFAESDMPILYDLNSVKGRQFYGLDNLHSEVKFVQFRLKEGDDASCLNLNRVSSPQLISVNPQELTDRKAFTFTNTTPEVNSENPWSVLDKKLTGDIIPAVADETVIIWGLGKSVGDTLIYTDEKGGIFKVKLAGGLANSIFQGNIIISEKAFMQKYPSVSGCRLFLIDAPFNKMDTVSQELTWALQDQGLDLTKASTRLAEFNQVENTYLSIFLILGSLGLILGSIGIGIITWRNVNEQKGELAVLQALGFNKKSIQKLVLYEHVFLIFGGIILGAVSAVMAAFPTIIKPGTEVPFLTLIILLILVIANGWFWTRLAASLALKDDILPALRNE